MFSDPQFWVAVSFVLFIAAIFSPVRKMLISSLDAQISDIKSKIYEAENLKSEAQKTLDELKLRENEVEKEIDNLKIECRNKIAQLKQLSSYKLSEQIEKRRVVAQNKIEQTLRDANLSVKNYITNVAIEVTTNILQEKLTNKEKSDLIDVSIKDLNSVLKN
tara:strand:+ start:31 stop:516 length:486 start_codon:yes stop_codon:yes gene_type:complete